MKRLYVILSDGHGEDTEHKGSPIFRTATKVGDVEFLPGERFQENYFNASVSNLVEKKLKRLGFPVQQLAPEDADIPLSVRKTRQHAIHHLAEKRGFLPITLSIHANGLGDGSAWNTAQGIETYHKGNCPESLRLANIIQRNVIDFRKHYQPYNTRTDRGVKTANFYVFRNYKGIVVLPESEFMTNLETLKLLCSDSFILNTAVAYVKAVEEFQGFSHLVDADPKNEKRV